MNSRTRTLVIVALFATVSLLVIPVYPHFLSPNEFTRWVLAASMVEERSIEVSRMASLLGERFEDLAVIDGRVYSNKAPGAALVGTIGYLIARPFTGPPAADSMRWSLTAMRLVGATLPLILLALLMARVATELGFQDRAPLVLATLLFATPLFAYGLLFFAHALVASSLFAAWVFLFLDDRPLVAGALMGMAVLSEYPAIVPALVMIGMAAVPGVRRVIKIIAGGLPFAILMAVYHYLAFGSVVRFFSGSYEKLPAYRELSRSGVYGIHFPSLLTILEFFFHPAVGLFILSPILILALPAMLHVRRELPPRAFGALVLVPLSIVLVYSGYPNWEGGWSAGPRYILSIVPFLAFALLFRKPDNLEALLLGFSAVAVALVALVFPFVPVDFPIPWGSLSLRLLRDGLVAPNLLHLVWRPAAIVTPFLLVAFAIALATRRWMTAAGGAIAICIGMAAATDWTTRQSVERAYFEDVFFERRGTLERTAPPGAAIFRRRDLEMKLPPSSWRF